MKKVFLSLAAVAVLSVVSCKKEVTEPVEVVDTTAVEAPAVDTTAAPATAAPAATPAPAK